MNAQVFGELELFADIDLLLDNPNNACVTIVAVDTKLTLRDINVDAVLVDELSLPARRSIRAPG